MKSKATATAQVYVDNVAPGTIVMFSGSEIPEGWVLCDGTNGTPDLRNKFIYGAETPAADKWPKGGNKGNTVTLVGDNIPEISGGSHNHSANLTETGGGHTHTFWNFTMNGYGQQINCGNMASNGDHIGLWYDTTGASGEQSVNNVTVDVAGNTDNATLSIGNPNPTSVNICPEYLALAFIMKA